MLDDKIMLCAGAPVKIILSTRQLIIIFTGTQCPTTYDETLPKFLLHSLGNKLHTFWSGQKRNNLSQKRISKPLNSGLVENRHFKDYNYLGHSKPFLRVGYL